MIEAVSQAVSSQLALLETSVAKRRKKEELPAIQDGIAEDIEDVTEQKQLTDKEEDNDTATVETPEIPARPPSSSSAGLDLQLAGSAAEVIAMLDPLVHAQLARVALKEKQRQDAAADALLKQLG